MSYECIDKKCIIISSCGRYMKSNSIFTSQKDAKNHAEKEHLRIRFVCRICGFYECSLRTVRYHWNQNHKPIAFPPDSYFDLENWKSTFKFDLDRFYLEKIIYFPDLQDDSTMDQARWISATKQANNRDIQKVDGNVSNQINTNDVIDCQYSRNLVVMVQVIDVTTNLSTLSGNVVEDTTIPHALIRSRILTDEIHDLQSIVVDKSAEDRKKPKFIYNVEEKVSKWKEQSQSDEGIAEALEFSMGSTVKKEKQCCIIS